MFRSARGHHKGIKPKQCDIKTKLTKIVTFIKPLYKETSTFWTLDSYKTRNLSTKVTNLYLLCIILVSFLHDCPMRVETCSNIQCDIITEISTEQVCIFCWFSTDMRCLTTGIPSEKCVVRGFRRCANVIVCTYIILDCIAYYTPRLYGITDCSWFFKVVSFLQVYPPRSWTQLISPPYVLNSPPPIFFFTWWPEKYVFWRCPRIFNTLYSVTLRLCFFYRVKEILCVLAR